MFTDSKSLFDTVVKQLATTEKQLETDFHVIGEAYTRHEIIDIAFIRSSKNPADDLAMANTNGTLECVLQENILSETVVQWVIQRRSLSKKTKLGPFGLK